MTAQTDLRPDNQISRERDGGRKRLDVVGLLVLLLAMAAAAVMGVAVVARVTNPPAPTRSSSPGRTPTNAKAA